MTKKVLLTAVLACLITAGAFAQFSIEAGVRGWTEPVIGVEYGFEKVDILAGFVFYYNNYEYDYEEPNKDGSYDYNTWRIGFYIGAAPKVSLSDKWTLSFPIMGEFSFDETSPYNFADKRINYSAGLEGFSLMFKLGAKAKFAFNENWSIYTGFLINAVTYSKTEYSKWKGPTTDDGTETEYTYSVINVFNAGRVLLGINFTF